MTEALAEVLQASGWFPGRSIPIDHWLNKFAEYGISIVQDSLSILRGFGGLTVHPVRSSSDKYAPGVLAFDPLLACEPDRIQWCEQRLQLKLTPLGEVGGQACLVLASNGAIFSIWDGVIFKDGDSFLEAMEKSLVFGHEAPIRYVSCDDVVN